MGTVICQTCAGMKLLVLLPSVLLALPDHGGHHGHGHVGAGLYQAPPPPPPPVVHEPAYHAPAPHYKEEAHPYHYEYGVHDDYHGTNFNAGETADGTGRVEGSYSVLLPDGRTQHVKYHADHYTGYVAEVTYEGVAHFPEHHPGYGHGGHGPEG